MSNEVKILIADDDEHARAIVSSAVHALDYTVITAIDGDEAISKCKAEMPDFAILDMTMPGCSGVEVCAWIKAQQEGRHVPVLILTANHEIEHKVLALESGADDYVTKPFHFEELKARINAFLRVRTLNLSLHEQTNQLARAQEKIIDQEKRLLALQFAGTAAHQLGQPLTAMKLNCHLLEALPKDDDRFGVALEGLKQDIETVVDLLTRLSTVDHAEQEPYFRDTLILKMDELPAEAEDEAVLDDRKGREVKDSHTH